MLLSQQKLDHGKFNKVFGQFFRGLLLCLFKKNQVNKRDLIHIPGLNSPTEELNTIDFLLFAYLMRQCRNSSWQWWTTPHCRPSWSGGRSSSAWTSLKSWLTLFQLSNSTCRLSVQCKSEWRHGPVLYSYFSIEITSLLSIPKTSNLHCLNFINSVPSVYLATAWPSPYLGQQPSCVDAGPLDFLVHLIPGHLHRKECSIK